MTKALDAGASVEGLVEGLLPSVEAPGRKARGLLGRGDRVSVSTSS